MRVVAVLLKKKLCIHIGSGYEICLRHCTLYPHSCGCVRYVFEGAMMCVCVCSWVHYVNWCMHCYAWFDADWVWKFNRAIFARVCVFVFVFVCSLVCWASAYFFFCNSFCRHRVLHMMVTQHILSWAVKERIQNTCWLLQVRHIWYFSLCVTSVHFVRRQQIDVRKKKTIISTLSRRNTV